MTQSMKIKGPDGDKIEVEFEEFGSVERLMYLARAPDDFIEQADGDGIELTPDLIDYFTDIIVSQTILTEDLLNEIEMVEITRLIAAAAQLLADEEIDVPEPETGDDYRFDDSERDAVEFNDDGSVDLDDWR